MGVIKNVAQYDEETGEYLGGYSHKIGSKLKGDWIVFYKDALLKLIKECPNYSTMKVYMMMAASQTYDSVTLVSLPYIAKELGIAYQTVWNSAKWLQQSGYIRRAEYHGNTGFVLNPDVTTCGKKNMENKAAYVAGDLSNDELIAGRRKATVQTPEQPPTPSHDVLSAGLPSAEEDFDMPSDTELDEEYRATVRHGDDIDLDGFDEFSFSPRQADA